MTRSTHKRKLTVQQRAKRIRVLLMDVDGVLTDSRVYLQSQPDGSALELKAFNAHDGVGLNVARLAGLRTGIITGRESAAVTRRAKETGLEFVYQGQHQKLPAFEEILRKARVTEAEVAYMGDDLPDIPILRRAGLAVAVANASPEVKRAAHYTTRRAGGFGAVREVIELILKSQDKWNAMVEKAPA